MSPAYPPNPTEQLALSAGQIYRNSHEEAAQIAHSQGDTQGWWGVVLSQVASIKLEAWSA